jgi:hypothetical protein
MKEIQMDSRSRLTLVVSNHLPTAEDPLVADGYLAYQLFSRVGGKRCHAVGTRLPGHLNIHDLGRFWLTFEPVATACNGKLDIRSMVSTQELVIWCIVPLETSRESFLVFVEKFKFALKESGIILNPIECEIPEGLHRVM